MIDNKTFVFSIILFFLLSISCNKQENPSDYYSLLKEIHKIECDHVNQAGIVITETSSYKFRSEAFQYIMKNPDRRVLAKYEDFCSKLASLIYTMDEKQKLQYESDLEAEYSNSCY